MGRSRIPHLSQLLPGRSLKVPAGASSPSCSQGQQLIRPRVTASRQMRKPLFLTCALACAIDTLALHNCAHAQDLYEALYAHIHARPRTLLMDLSSSTADEVRTTPDGGSKAPPNEHARPVRFEADRPDAQNAPLAASDIPFVDMILLAAQRYHVPAPLIHAVIQVESGFNPNARSAVGAVGLMQLMPATATAFGVHNRRNPLQNILGGTCYLRFLLDRFDGDLRRALSAYNAGPAAVDRHGGVPPYRAVRHYVRRVLERYYQLRPRYSLAARM